MKKESIEFSSDVTRQAEPVKWIEVAGLTAGLSYFLPVAIVAIFGVWRNTFSDVDLMGAGFAMFFAQAFIMIAFKRPVLVGVVLGLAWTGLFTYMSFVIGKANTGYAWLPPYITPCLATVLEGWLVLRAAKIVDLEWITGRLN